MPRIFRRKSLSLENVPKVSFAFGTLDLNPLAIWIG